MMGYTLLDTPNLYHNLASIKIAKKVTSMEIRFFESYRNSPSINWRGRTRGGKRSLDRRGHAGLVLVLHHEADSLAV